MTAATGGAEDPRIDVVLSVHDGGPWLAPQIESIRAQTHGRWRLWIRDDGSTDGSGEVARDFADRDPRIRAHPSDGRQLGASRGFGWLLERLPADAGYVMCSDADDVWLPDKMTRSLAFMREAEARRPGPVLVHSDLRVVDEELNVVDDSFWRFAGFDPEPADLSRLVVQNVATGPTLFMNEALVRRVAPIPEEAIHQDWWIALVAAAVGRLEVMREATVLYRQHAGQHVGARGRSGAGLTTLPARLKEAWERRSHVRRFLGATAEQAGALLGRFADDLGPRERERLRAYAALPAEPGLERKLWVLRNRLLPEHGILRNLGVLLRA